MRQAAADAYSIIPSLEPALNITLRQHSDLPSQAALATRSCVVFALAGAPDSWPRRLPWRTLLLQQYRAEDKPADRVFTIDIGNTRGTRVAATVLPAACVPFLCLERARQLVAAAQGVQRPRDMALVVSGYAPHEVGRVAEALVTATLAATAPLPSYKAEPTQSRLRRLYLHGYRNPDGFERTFYESEGNALARSLAMQPGNRLQPADYRERLDELREEYGWALQFLDEADLKRRGAGAFLSVCQGSARRDAGIACLKYRPAVKRRRRVALVGKGICYDTGGVNVKPARYMYGMHGDMQGSAVALGTLLALTRLKVDFPVDCWLALARNDVGPGASVPGDVVSAVDGTTIEIIHTDAEGRMVLADTLALAARTRGLGLILDYATLTGACVQALGSGYSGAFSNQPQWLQTLITAGRNSGERVWPFPLDKDYDRALSSEIADVRQCSPSDEADHILAARFLSRFVGETPWIHFDLAAATCKGGLGHVPSRVTGFGVRLSLHLLLDGILDGI